MKSSLRLNVKVFFVPTFEPAGNKSVVILRGRDSGVVGAAKYEAWISYILISVTFMGLVLNCLLRLAPWKAAPRTEASSALTFNAIFSLKLHQLVVVGRGGEHIRSNGSFNSSLNHWCS